MCACAVNLLVSFPALEHSRSRSHSHYSCCCYHYMTAGSGGFVTTGSVHQSAGRGCG